MLKNVVIAAGLMETGKCWHMEFELSGSYSGREGLMKDVIESH